MGVQSALLFSVQEALPMFLFLSLCVVSLFSFIGVSVWSDARRRERVAYYKNDMLKKVAQARSSEVASVLEVLREQDRIDQRRLRESIKLSGLVTSAAGIGLLVFLWAFEQGRPVYLCGLIPLLGGFALLMYSYVLAPKK
jgi:hypothetical protein